MDDKRAQERRDHRSQVAIMKKATGELVSHFECAYDEAETKARAAISGKSELKYRITNIL